MKTSPADPVPVSHRILIIDDNPSIHEDFRKVLNPAASQLGEELHDEEVSIFGDAPGPRREVKFAMDFAFQGQEGLEKVRAAALAKQPYSVAFVDVRMPPGWNGIETITHIWREFPDLQIVICTAYSDYSWEDITKVVGNTDQLLVLKKPFDNIEVTQMAHALCKKWELTQNVNRQMADLDALVNQRTAQLREANVWLTAEIAERTAAQDALRSSEERFSKAFHGNPVPMAIQRTDGPGFLDVNERFVQLLGTARETVLAGNATFWMDGATAGLISGALSERRVVRDMVANIRTAAGGIREVLVAAENLNLGNAPYRLLILQDITDRVQIETELRHAQKMESVGRLAAGVAHDFNNILTVILGNASLQLCKPQLDDDLSLSLHQIVLAAERATALTRQLLAYGRKQIIQRRPLALNDAVGQTVSMLHRVIGEDVTIDLQLAPELPPVFADASNVNQVVMNLALNARDAMRGGGTLTITTSLAEMDEAASILRPGVTARRFACLAVKDTGHGMDAATLRHIFEPFFTTKDPGKGTGMGLATVDGILRQHNGWVDVESEPGHGSTFRVFFPLSTESATDAGVESAGAFATPTPKEQITILVVEDEDMLRRFVGETLKKLGYRVLSAPNGPKALEIWAEHRDEIDLLLTDVVMPYSMSGCQLAHKLVMDRPDLKVIFTSGYSSELIGTDFEQQKEHGFLPKPYVAEHLAAIVAAQFQPRPLPYDRGSTTVPDRKSVA